MFNFTDTVAFDFDRTSRAYTNDVVTRVSRDRDLKCRTEFRQEKVGITRDLFNSSCYTCTILPTNVEIVSKSKEEKGELYEVRGEKSVGT